MVGFTAADYAVFAVALAVSGAIGVFYALRPACKRGRAGQAQAMLTGGHKLPMLPTAISLLCSFVSGIALLSYPEEIYKKGTAFVWSLLGAVLAVSVTGIFILPVLHPLRYVNLYQYLEERFNSRTLRYYGDVLFVATSVVYSAVVLYVPCQALQQVTVLPLWALLLLVGLVCTAYTAIGGIKAVIWTDTFQGVVMYAGVITLLVKGVLAVRAMGGSTFELAKAGARLEGFTNIDFDPFQYMTVWTAVFGGMFFWLGAFGANQMALQRFCSVPTLNRARFVALLNIPGITVVFALVFAIGLVMYAFNSATCHPRGVAKDGLVIHFMLQIMSSTYGFPGLFMAAVMSGTLSSVSSAINSLTAVTMTDLVNPLAPGMGPRMAHVATVTISFVYGLLVVGGAFLVGPLGGAMRVLFNLLGALAGPAVGLLLFGILVPWADDVGGLLGVFAGCTVNLLVLASKVVYKPHRHQNLPDPEKCCAGNATFCLTTDPAFLSLSSLNGNSTLLVAPSWLEHLSSLSGLMLPLTGVISTLLIGMSISMCSRRSNSERRPELVFWSRNRKRPKSRPLDLYRVDDYDDNYVTCTYT